jgi:AcrR family transcriptional regulator
MTTSTGNPAPPPTGIDRPPARPANAAPDAPARPDGRTARAERTRRAIIVALLDLIDEGDLKASAERIADRAGVSLRALWTNFRDLETLYAAAGARLTELQEAEWRPVPLELDLARRVEEFCRQRVRMLEIIAPAARAAQLRMPYSPQLRRNRAHQNERVKDELERLFRHELTMAGPRGEELAHALLAATTWHAWAALRDDLGLDAEAAQHAMHRTVLALLQR